ncbi:DUF952 domain-containing protein [Algimonas porphyrae]|uniref:DUF952 domain-containing protein n=1 Tax=Algimonas porphyrae TaxID=1128113 RepID=A0ABQ5V3S6_9PROT|nr:DUF952 domain-containing protein [Algimonas porphyrae]GLQ21702.1 hypothetical protein GCM10007854_26570 [Algimonas porphyrae]
MNDPDIYKILTSEQWRTLARDGSTVGSPLDQQDGFVHFSTAAQLSGTLSRHFKGAGELVLAQISTAGLDGAVLRWEPARDGSLFPHLYAALPKTAVRQHWTLHPDGQGRYALPDLTN